MDSINNIKKSNNNPNNSKVLDSIKNLKTYKMILDNHQQIEMERLGLNPLKDEYKIDRALVLPIVQKTLLGHTSSKEPGEHKEEDISKFYETTTIFHTDEKKQDKGRIIPIGYVNDGSDDYLDIFYNKDERAFEGLGYTDKYFDQYKQILKLNKNINTYVPKKEDNLKTVLDNINEGEFITKEAYQTIHYITEKFSHNIETDYEDYNETLAESLEVKMFEVRENGFEEGMTRELHIVIDEDNKGETYFVDYINNSAEIGKQIKYERQNGWHDYPYKNIGENLEIEIDNDEVRATEGYEWDKKTDMSTLKDYQKVNIINTLNFNLYKKEYKFKLEDSEQANLANIENEEFNNLDEVLQRLDTYIYDYYFRDSE